MTDKKLYSALGHELHIGEYVGFTSVGHKIYGKIIDVVGEKIVCKPIAWRGDNEFEEKLRKTYKVLAKNAYLINIKTNEKNQIN